MGFCEWANDLVSDNTSPWKLSSYRSSKRSVVQRPDHGGRLGKEILIFDSCFSFSVLHAHVYGMGSTILRVVLISDGHFAIGQGMANQPEIVFLSRQENGRKPYSFRRQFSLAEEIAASP